MSHQKDLLDFSELREISLQILTNEFPPSSLCEASHRCGPYPPGEQKEAYVPTDVEGQATMREAYAENANGYK